MILKKPYAVFIKYFRQMHGIMSLFIMFVLLRFFNIFSFFRIYSIDYRAVTNINSITNYFDYFFLLIIFFVIFFNIIILVVVYYKKKPFMLYIFNLLLFISSLVLYYSCFNYFRASSSLIMDVRTSKAFRDFYLIFSFLQLVSFIFVFVRAVGFDIKRFDFVSDLQELDISEKDSEEIEVSLDVDFLEIRSNFKRNIRNFKYVYVEHKFLINFFVLLFISFLAFFIYYNVHLRVSKYNQGESFNASGFEFSVLDSYIVDSNSRGNKIIETDGEYPGAVVAVKIKVRSNGVRKKLNTGLLTLNVGDFSYGYQQVYAKELDDIGETYYDDEISSDYKTYILAFEILDSFTNKKLTLKVNDNLSFVNGKFGAKNIYISLKPSDLRENGESYKKKLGGKISFNSSILKNSSLIINNYEVSNKFKLGYKFCFRDENCFDSYEYVTPSATGSYFKTLMKINSDLSLDEGYSSSDIYDIRTLLNNYGSIYYLIGDEWRHNKIDSSLIKPKYSSNNDVFLEVPYGVGDASEIYLKIKIRNQSYKYILKGS